MYRLACKCNAAAKDKGYKYFGLRFWGICVGYSKIITARKSNEFCKDGSRKPFRPCNLDDSDHDCVGDENMSDMVYEIGE